MTEGESDVMTEGEGDVIEGDKVEFGSGRVRQLVRRFSQNSSVSPPPLQRRSTVARCSGVAVEVRKRCQQFQQFEHNSDSQTAASAVEFTVVMERLSSLISSKPASSRNEQEDQNSQFARNDALRRTLPRSGLKSYMRTKSEPQDNIDKKLADNASPQTLQRHQPSAINNSPDNRRKTSRGNKLQVRPSSISRQSSREVATSPETNRRTPLKVANKTVACKPKIPSVLRKTSTPSKSIAENTKDHVTTTRKVSTGKDLLYDLARQQRSPSRMEVPAILKRKCKQECHYCSMIDLWLAIWKIQSPQV